MRNPTHAATTSEVVTAALHSPELHEIAAMLPIDTDVGRPREMPGWSVLLLGVLARHFRSGIRSEAELHTDLLWHHVQREAATVRVDGAPITAAPRPATWSAWRRARDQHWATEAGLATISAIHLRHATDLAHQLGLARPDGPGSWSHPDKTRAVYGDGTLVRTLYKPPTAIRTTSPDGTIRVAYPDPVTGELLEAPTRRYDPDTAEHHGHRGPVHGINYVAWHLRGPHYFQRVILTIGRVPAPGQEAETAVALLANVRRAFGDGIQVAVYDGAFRGVHIDTIMRRDGYVVLTKPATDHDNTAAPQMLRLPGGKSARSLPLGSWEHQVGRRRCVHLLAAVGGSPAEIALDESGDPTLVAVLTRRQVKRPRCKDGRYRFSVAYEVPCPHDPFWVWLSPHAERGDDTARRAEHLRIIAASDPDGAHIVGIRSDAEAHHDLFKQTLRNSRAMSLGGDRGLLDQFCFALGHNALVTARAAAGIDGGMVRIGSPRGR